MKFSLFLPALFLLAASCSMQPTPASLSGSWTQPVPGQPGHVQGMQLLPDGRAVSINMHTLLYQGWQLDGSRLMHVSLTPASIAAWAMITPSATMM